MGRISLMSPIGPICFSGRRVVIPGRQRVEHEHEHEHEHEGEGEGEGEALDQADEVEKKTGPEIEHAAPGVANFAVAGGSQETGPDIVIDLLL
jgi:hypothetical protein